MRREGPYREQGSTKKTIEQLRKEISKKNMVGIQLPENIRSGDFLEEFTTLEQFGFRKKEGMEKYKNIALYSHDLGILNFVGSSKNPPDDAKILYWEGKSENENFMTDLTIYINHNTNEVKVFSIYKDMPKRG